MSTIMENQQRMHPITVYFQCVLTEGFPGGTVVKNTLANPRDAVDTSSIPRWGGYPGIGNGNPHQYFLPRESHGQRSLVGYSPQGPKESDTTE